MSRTSDHHQQQPIETRLDALLDQLAIGGRLVLPLGDADHQRLVWITRRGADEYMREELGDVRFVPLLGEQGWPVG